MDQYFLDGSLGYFETASDHAHVLMRGKSNHDDVLPSATSVALTNLIRLYHFTSNESYQALTYKILHSMATVIEQSPHSYRSLLQVVDMWDDDIKEIVIVHPDDSAKRIELDNLIRATYLPNSVFVSLTESEVGALAEKLPFISGKYAIGGKSTAYVCYNRICKLPTSDFEVLTELLADVDAETERD